MELINAQRGWTKMVGESSTKWHLDRQNVIALGLVLATLLVPPKAQSQGADASKPTYLYVGSYTKNPPGGGSNNPIGLSVFKFDAATGALSPVQQVPSANPSFVALH